MAVFPESVDQAIRAAVAQLDAVRDYNAERMAQGRAPMQIGLGIHYGKTMLGMVGEAERMQLDLLSDSVNLASRLEGLTKIYGASIIASEDAVSQVADADAFSMRFLGVARVKGRQAAVSLFEILDGENEGVRSLKQETRDVFEEGLRLYHEKQFADASVRFNLVKGRNPDDRAAVYYLARAAEYMVRGAPQAWGGVDVME